MCVSTFRVIGRVVSVHEDKIEEKGEYYVKLAVNQDYKDKSDQWQNVTDYHFVRVRGKSVPATFNVGNLVAVEGELRVISKGDKESGYETNFYFNVDQYRHLHTPKKSDE